MTKQGDIFVISSPSGGGKTSLIAKLLDKVSKIQLSISYTTRARRKSEIDKRNYYFIAETEFMEMKERGDFLEDAIVFGNKYGTAQQSIIVPLQNGYDVILDIDWQGAKQIKHSFPQAILIFLLPPSINALKERLLNRAADDNNVIQKRLLQAEHDISQYKLFDYLVVNDNFEDALNNVISIIISTRLKREKSEESFGELIKELTSTTEHN